MAVVRERERERERSAICVLASVVIVVAAAGVATAHEDQLDVFGSMWMDLYHVDEDLLVTVDQCDFQLSLQVGEGVCQSKDENDETLLTGVIVKTSAGGLVELHVDCEYEAREAHRPGSLTVKANNLGPGILPGQQLQTVCTESYTTIADNEWREEGHWTGALLSGGSYDPSGYVYHGLGEDPETLTDRVLWDLHFTRLPILAQTLRLVDAAGTDSYVTIGSTSMQYALVDPSGDGALYQGTTVVTPPDGVPQVFGTVEVLQNPDSSYGPSARKWTFTSQSPRPILVDLEKDGAGQRSLIYEFGPP